MLTDAQKSELTEWRHSDVGKAIIADGRAKAKAKRLKLAEGKKTGGGGGSDSGNGTQDNKRNKKYQSQVKKAAKKLLASSLEAEKVEADAMDAQLDAAIQRRRGADVGATAVVPPKSAAEGEAAKEKAVADKQTVLKLSSVLSQIKVGKTGIKQE